MQFLISAEEYDRLNDAKELVRKQLRMVIQELCIRVARSEHVEFPGPVIGPNGCMLERDPVSGKFKHPSTPFGELPDGHCDACPVIDVCPYIDKGLSK
jgi:hypothetical protein